MVFLALYFLYIYVVQGANAFARFVFFCIYIFSELNSFP